MRHWLGELAFVQVSMGVPQETYMPEPLKQLCEAADFNGNVALRYTSIDFDLLGDESRLAREGVELPEFPNWWEHSANMEFHLDFLHDPKCPKWLVNPEAPRVRCTLYSTSHSETDFAAAATSVGGTQGREGSCPRRQP